MNHRVRSVLAAVLIMVVSILLPSDFQFENTDRFVKEQSSSIQMTAQYTDGFPFETTIKTETFGKGRTKYIFT